MTASDRGGDPETVDPAEVPVEAVAPLAPSDKPAAAGERGGRLVNRTVVGVVFAIGDAPRDVDCIGLMLEPGDRVLVETTREPRPATVATRAQVKAVDPHKIRRVIRRIQDSQAAPDRSSAQEREAFAFCQDQIRLLRLPMKLVRVEIGQGGARLTFHFASEERVDFRSLVRELARRFRARIEMRQIGVRDQAKLVGGLGLCGRELCCGSWIHRFAPVSIRMAKDQGLALNPQKVSGVCGRLLCCLNYEEEIYRELRVGLPKVGKRIQTPSGEGRVRDVDVLKGRVRVLLESGLKEFTREDLCTGCPGICARHAEGGTGAEPVATSSTAPRPAAPVRSLSPRGPRPPEAAIGACDASSGEPAPDGSRRSRRGRRRGGEVQGEPEAVASPRPAAVLATPAPAAKLAVPEVTPPPPAPALVPPPEVNEDDGDADEVAGTEVAPAEGSSPDGEAPRKRRRRRRRRKPRGGDGGTPPPDTGPATTT